MFFIVELLHLVLKFIFIWFLVVFSEESNADVLSINSGVEMANEFLPLLFVASAEGILNLLPVLAKEFDTDLGVKSTSLWFGFGLHSKLLESHILF